MLAPLSWLKEFVKVSVSAEKLAENLLLSGTKVEQIRRVGKEIVFDLEITPNRPDTLGIYGIAREIATVQGSDLLPLDTDLLIPTGRLESAPALKITDKKLCPSYTLGLLRSVRVKPSPTYLAERLKLVGIRPVNNVVDITNYVMWETGQPLHAFDFDKIDGELTLRASKEGEQVRTLDGISRKLSSGSIIIEDSRKLIDLAGLMGGENSEIDEGTQNILLHVPIYDPIAIRRTSQQTGLRTESSNRFEKKLDRAGHITAFERATKLITEIAGGRVSSETKSISAPTKKSLIFDLGILKEVLGIEVKLNQVVNILSSLGFQVSLDPFQENQLRVGVPSWRGDIEGAIDLTEEIGRIYGYNRFPKTLPKGAVPVQKELYNFDWEKFIVQVFREGGFNQTMTHTLLSKKTLERASLEPSQTLKVANPMTEDFEFLRPSLYPELLVAISRNRGKDKIISFFEIGRVFEKEVSQPKIVSFVSTKPFSQVKGVLEKVVKRIDPNPKFEKVEETTTGIERYSFDKGKLQLAELSLVNPTILKNFEINQTVSAGSIFLEKLSDLQPNYLYQPLPKFPPVIEDLSMFVASDLPARKILDIAWEGTAVSEAEVFDIFREGNQKSVAVKITFQAKDRTLTDKEVAVFRAKIERNLEKKLLAKIRKA